jgi:lambda family phage portal protein
MKKIEVRQNVVDRVIGYFDPVRAKERLKARYVLSLAGGYSGASTTRRSLSSWITGNRDADGDITLDQDRLRQRSRDLIRNAPIAAGAVGLVVTNTVGTGLKLQSRIDRDYLRMTDEQAEEWESSVEREWSLWADSQECDCARTLTFADLQVLAFRQTLENGDAFSLLPRFKRGNNPYLLKVQMIEADRVTNKSRAQNTATLVNGIVKDSRGAPVAYQIQRKHPGSLVSKGAAEWDEVQAYNEKTGLRNVLHLYTILRAGQSRGVPYLAPVIESLKQLERYTEAELMAAVVSGMFTVFVKTETGANLPIPAYNPTTETGATSSDEDYKLGNGSIVGLAPNESIETANPGRPNQAFDPFISAILRQIGMALEIPYEVLIRHFSASYSASRAALLNPGDFSGAAGHGSSATSASRFTRTG